MREDLRKLDESISSMSADEMASTFHQILAEYDELLSLQAEKDRATHEMSIQFSQMKSYSDGCEKENIRLKEELVRLSDQLNLRNKDLFGRSTEKTKTVMDPDHDDSMDQDPVSEDQPENTDGSGTGRPSGGHKGGRTHHNGNRTKGKNSPIF